VIAAFAVSVLSFAALGVFLGAVLPTARAAQGLGMILFFVMLILGGAGPPREVMTDAMGYVGDATPLWHAILLLQDPWLGLGWNNFEFIVVAGIMVAAALMSAVFFRWE
jgi:ABC-2 type transport system permease protein